MQPYFYEPSRLTPDFDTMSKLAKAQHSQGHSRTFFEYVRSVGECKSKQEEDRIVVKDLAALKAQMSEKKVDAKAMKEMVVRMCYAEMLGHSAEFGHINAVNLASAADLHHKRTGYLATWLAVNPEHEFMYLIVASLQRDMKSPSYLEVATALTAACKLVKPELLSAINPDVVQLTSHANGLVRKKATSCMHGFWRRSDGVIGDHQVFRQMLCDRDPGVMGASLSLFYDVALADPVGQKELLPSFLSILKQIVEHRLSREFDYHRIPAPWMQIRLLKIIAVLAADDAALSQQCVDILTEVIRRADTGLNIGHAVVYEAVVTVTSLYPIPALMEAAADAIAKFLTSTASNLKYLGIIALSKIVKIDPKYAQEHQHIVIDCLEDSDETIRRKTLSLLFAMCNANNVEPISARLLRFLANATDKFLREEIVRNLCDVADRFNDGNLAWYIATMNRILELAGEHVTQTTVQGMLKVIAEGTGDDEAEDAQFRTQCVEDYFNLVEDPEKQLPPVLCQIVAWIIGEYGFLTRKVSRAMMLDRLCDMAERTPDAETKGWVVTAMMKIVAHNGDMPDNVEDIVAKLQNSRNPALQQRCYEFMAMAKMMPLMKKVLPLDGCCEDIDVDEDLSFLDNIVEEALANGARPYQKKEVVLGGDAEKTTVKTETYKSHQVDVVDTEELDRERFNEDEPDRLVVREKRWGAKNLEGEAAVDPATVAPANMEELEEEPQAGATPEASQHADPMAGDGPRKPTKNEKFMSDIFSGGGKKKKGAKRGARAAEAAKRAAAAEEATAGMTFDNREEILGDDTPAEAPVAPAEPTAAPVSAAEGVKVEFQIQKQLAADALLLRVGVLSSSPLQKVSVDLAPPQGCLLSVKAGDGMPAFPIDGGAVTVGSMPGGRPLFLLVRIGCQEYPSGGALSVNIRYTAPTGPGTAATKHPLALVDLLRPLAVPTDAFGKVWPTLAANEAAVQLQFPAALTPEVLSKQLERVGARILQVIGKECIAAAQVVPGAKPVLLHINVGEGNQANVLVRSNSKPFSGVVSQALAAGL